MGLLYQNTIIHTVKFYFTHTVYLFSLAFLSVQSKHNSADGTGISVTNFSWDQFHLYYQSHLSCPWIIRSNSRSWTPREGLKFEIRLVSSKKFNHNILNAQVLQLRIIKIIRISV